ncbi:MAG: RdgB/HAM1 family non-canonical purine NTP pyrophosphatase [Oscillospiraceae bacterium]|nr:RdgB/HAM1 family non-canonical purine NTP pyrophosphatase [Oscillospiraceae bacterium]MBR2977672.1 RdgB/HAM1 family non-canonical purine NTP pyrophosphatase [Oscillospiraceae bacterium]
MKIVLASLNPNKLREMREPLLELGIDLIPQTDLSVFGSAEENGDTFEANAELKARYVMEATGLPAIADDSGLAVDALDGAPGVYSHRFGNLDSDAARNNYLLEKLKDVPDEKRGAKFVSVIALVFPDGKKLIVRGECPGVILHESRGQNGFGYDPLFYVETLGKTFAELTNEEKHSVSHRGCAIRNFAKVFKEMNGYSDE